MSEQLRMTVRERKQVSSINYYTKRDGNRTRLKVAYGLGSEKTTKIAKDLLL